MLATVFKRLRSEAEEMSKTNAQLFNEWREKGDISSEQGWNAAYRASGQQRKDLASYSATGLGATGIAGLLGVAMANQAAGTAAMYAGMTAAQSAAVAAAGLATSAGSFTTMMAGVGTALSGLGTVAVAGTALPVASVVALGVAAAGAVSLVVSRFMVVDWDKGSEAARTHDRRLATAASLNPDERQQPGVLDWLKAAKSLIATGLRGLGQERGVAEIVSEPAVNKSSSLEEYAISVMRTAKATGVQLDVLDVLDVLKMGNAKNGSFVGMVVHVDMQRGVVYQSGGRGQGIVHPVAALDRVPTVGQVATINVRGGRGVVQVVGQELER